MDWWQAALWGLAGGGAATVVSLTAAVAAAGYTWPWRTQGELGPWLFVLAAGFVLGCGVAAAASGQISGPWPAFAFGAGAPATIRGIASGVEVTPRADPPPARPTAGESEPTVLPPLTPPRPAPEGEAIREEAP